MAVESQAYFTKKLDSLGLIDLKDQMANNGWRTMGTFAFAANFTPGNADDSPFINEVVVPLLGDSDHPSKAALRRLFFDCYTAMAAEAQRSVLGNEDDSKPRKLPGPERAHRLQEVKQDLSGLKISGPLEPSHALVDKVTSMVETGELRHVPWAELTTREAEIRGHKVDEILKVDATGGLKIQRGRTEDPADVSTESKIRFALQRRDIAFQMGRLLSYRVHDELISWYQVELDRKPLPGFSTVTLDQVHRVDCEIFSRLTELVQEDLSLDEMGKPPLDTLLPIVMNEPRIQAMLFPPRSGTTRREPDGELQELRAEVKRLKSSASSSSFQKGKGQKGKGKGKDKGKGKNDKNRKQRPTNLPARLRGCNPTINGQKPCFAFNLDGCSGAAPGGTCPRGLHKCMKCGANHGACDPQYHQ